MPVTSVGKRAFSWCESLTEVTIPDSVTNIGHSAFFCCSSLTEVTIPSSVTSIGNFVFAQSGLTSITIPNSVTSIGRSTFFGCSRLIDVTFPDSVTSIGSYAFSCCSNLTSITIPDSVTSIGGGVFWQTPWLESQRKISPLVIVNNILIDGSTYEGDVVILDSVTIVGEGAFSGCSGLSSVTISESVKVIKESAFSRCSGLTSIMIKNPDCEIYDSSDTISDTATIYGYEGSTAQTYTETYERNFVSLGEVPATDSSETLAGDVNLDGEITIADVVTITAYVGNPEKNSLDQQSITNGDVHSAGDGLTANDALAIQQYLANIISSFD